MAAGKDGLNIKAALNSLTEHIFCIVLTEYIFVLIFPIKCKLPRFGSCFHSFQQLLDVGSSDQRAAVRAK